MARAPSSRGGTVSRARGASAPIRLVSPSPKPAITPAGGQSARSFAPSSLLPSLTHEEEAAIHPAVTFGQKGGGSTATTSDAASSLAAAIAAGVAAASLGGGGSSGGGSGGGSDPSIDTSGDTSATPDDGTDLSGTDDPNADPTADDPNAIEDPSSDPTLGGTAVADAAGIALADPHGVALAPVARPPMARWVKVLGLLLMLGVGGWAAYTYLWPRAKRSNPKRRRKKKRGHPYAKGGRAGPEVWR